MKRFKNALFLASVASSAIIATGAQAQVTASNDGELFLHGTGATSVQLVLVQELNCKGGTPNALTPPDFWLGAIGSSTVAGTVTFVAEPTDLPTAGGTNFNCATTELEPGFKARYVGSGSGAGRTAWSSVGNLSAAFPGISNPFGTWTKVQYAFADSSASDADLTAYTGGPSLTGASYAAGGAPIMFPKFVLPVAVAYAPVYGHNSSTGHDYSFNIQFPQNILGNAAGGLRLSRETLCGVFNASLANQTAGSAIVNFNDPNFTADNGGTSLMDPLEATEAPGRWAADGVPVRLVGRLDRSGTTDIFTRALVAQCTGVVVHTVALTNNYKINAETLPYDRSVSASTRPVFQTVRADTGLQSSPGSTQLEAGNNTVTPTGYVSVGAEYFDGTSIVTPSTNTGKVSSQPGNPLYEAGRFLVADGSGRVAGAIKATGAGIDFASPSAPSVALNGKIGYIGADFIDGSPSAPGGLKAAALENDATGAYVMPSAQAATNAFGTIDPPQAVGTGDGSFNATDTRQVRIPAYMNGGVGGTLGNATRNNPFAWYDVLYAGTSLADPSVGYPITGTTQFLGYTCYKKDNSGSNGAAIQNFLLNNTDQDQDVEQDGNVGVFTIVGGTFNSSGLLARSNIGALSPDWMHAIRQSFLTVNSAEGSGALGALNLWIDETDGSGSTSNSTCHLRPGV
ncbi:hypothetical protein [Sphingomonas sp. dw_22]|uniref:hypothetical protein n=1 Tax=Sphingomonas sp. dw_22 TaxID=2721175 RepID=UPI001BD303D9|nr:hypothetical protein [Sphingomonas sp. dw_22]